MGKYTETLEDFSYGIDPGEDGYEEMLEKAAGSFRPFDVALTAFLTENGMIGEAATPDEVLRYITDEFKAAGIEPPRNRKKWFSVHASIKRKTAFEMCFALRLDEDQADDFFRRVCLERGFDGHDMTEIVWLYAIRNGLTYEEALRIQKKLPTVKTDQKLATGQVIYTQMIQSEIAEISSEEELIRYLTERASSFGYNNATATRFIRELWDEIAGEDGLAYRERRDFHSGYEEDVESYGRTDSRVKIRVEKDDSLWDVYLQILGLSHIDMKQLGTDRSLKPILKDRDLLHPLAEDSFPDRDGLNKILRGEHVSHERVRKILILLVFYRYWVRLLLKNRSYAVNGGEMARLEQTINNYLVDCGYPTLYIGNPYDWVILYSLVNSDTPLMTFRGFMQELYYRSFEGDRE
ncbi:MAG: hypothetical protein IJS24_00190 [Eubacterium sp.]|nr:hypothetical protein [Eubacterium sp.]